MRLAFYWTSSDNWRPPVIHVWDVSMVCTQRYMYFHVAGVYKHTHTHTNTLIHHVFLCAKMEGLS